MKHYGDITKIDGYKVPTVDFVVGGSPCQDLSQAGKRKGLQHSELGSEETTRSGLFMEQIRLVKEMRDADKRNRFGEGSVVDFRLLRPRYLLWENVPGAFSSNKGQDFRVVLEEISKIIDKDANVPLPKDGKWRECGSIVGNGWSLAWRVFDAQFWGIPQRRKRIALVADFGSECASEILFIRKGLSRDFDKGRQEGKDTSNSPSNSLRASDSIAIEGNGSRESHHGDGYSESDTMYTLNTTEMHAVAYQEVNPQSINYIVRRLTPLECERLQGFPDGWTDIGDWIDSKGKKRQTSDAARHKALGNSIALPSWKWVLKRVSAQYERNATMCSLFDGIGGFPLLWEQINGKGSCLWASEIDEFPMAVTKKHFGEDSEWSRYKW